LLEATLIEILSADIQASGENLTGQLLDGSISIRSAIMLALAEMKGSEVNSDRRQLQKSLNFSCANGAAARKLRLSAGSLDYKGVAHFDGGNRRKELEHQDNCVLSYLPIVLKHQARAGNREADPEWTCTLPWKV